MAYSMQERMTVNHDVAGSSPAGGARGKTRVQMNTGFSVVRLPRPRNCRRCGGVGILINLHKSTAPTCGL